MNRGLIAALVLILVIASVRSAPAASSYTIDQITNSPVTFTINDMSNTLLPPTSSTVQFRLNYTTTSSPGHISIIPGTIAGNFNFDPANIKATCSKVSGSGSFSGLSNVPIVWPGVTCGTMPANSSGVNIIITLVLLLNDTALAPTAFAADTFTGSLTISALDG